MPTLFERSGSALSLWPTAKRACCAIAKNGAPWSHAAVYLAGRDSDWFFLANQPENKSWPIYREHYEMGQPAAKGEVLEEPERGAAHP